MISEGVGYRLDLSSSQLDSAEFVTAVADAQSQLELGQADLAVSSLEAALGLWRGEAFADFVYEEFAAIERDRLNEFRVIGRELLTDAKQQLDGPEQVIPELEALVTEYPYREGLWERLMLALYRAGRQADALAVYQRARQVLGDELGLTPSPGLQDLEEQILLQDPSLAPEITEAVTHNLPAQTTRLIGRDELLEQLLTAVASDRLVTLLGPGGSGKTRLAIEAAARSAGRYLAGVWLVRLDDLSDGSLLAATIGADLGMPEAAHREVVESLVAFVGAKQMMLLLDNCEHLVPEVSRLVDRLLASCPGLVVLATSQEALNLRSERRFPVPPLGLPGAEGTPFGSLESSASVELFLERAHAIDPNLDMSESSMNAVANIVQALDGMPLAIELAAARTDLFTASEIAVRLTDRFEILQTGHRDAPHRQQTLRNVVDWSFRLLTDRERAFLARLGVFAGGFDLDAVAAVTETTVSEAEGLLSALIRRSLVTKVAAIGGTSRYRLLETIRRFGLERLDEDGSRSAISSLHAGYYADRVFELDQQIMGPEQLSAFATLVADEDNHRAAMAWSLESGQHAPGVRISARLGRFWDWRGSLADAGTWSGRFVAAVVDETYTDLGFLIGWRGYVQLELDRADEARQSVDRAVHIAGEHGDDHNLAMALTGVALLARIDGDLEKALEVSQRIRSLSPGPEGRWGVAWSRNHDALALLGLGRFEEAEAAASESLSGFEAVGDRRATGWALTAQAQAAHESGDHELVERLTEEAIAVSLAVGDGRNAAWAYEIAAASAKASGNEARATSLTEEAAHLLTERGMPFSPWRRQLFDK